MTTMRSSIAIVLLACAALAGCKPASDAPADGQPAPPATPAAVSAQPVDASAATPTYGVGNFAGVFGGTLPCADCPGIETTLTLKPDGSFTSRSVYRERATRLDEDGVWSVEDNRQVRLATKGPNPQVRLYAIVAYDRLRTLDADGKPIDAPFDLDLHRK